MNKIIGFLAALIGIRPPQLQVAALCMRRHKGAVEVLLITSRDTGRWIIPKGWPMRGRPLHGAAEQEAWEEAGVKGVISEEEVGRFRYHKILDGGLATPVDVRVFPLWVNHLEDGFPENSERRRAWFAPETAATKVREKDLQQLLLNL